MRLGILVVAACCVLASFAGGADDPVKKDEKKALVRTLRGVKLFPTQMGEPVITEAKDLAKAYTAELLPQNEKQVDFDKEKVVGFGWNGSSSSYLKFELRANNGKMMVTVAVKSPKSAAADKSPRGVWLVMPKAATWEIAKE